MIRLPANPTAAQIANLRARRLRTVRECLIGLAWGFAFPGAYALGAGGKAAALLAFFQ